MFAISLSLSLTYVYIMHALIVHIHYLHDILVLKLLYAWDYLLTLVFNQESKAAPQLLSRGILRR